jgi:molecular chaperone HtpG
LEMFTEVAEMNEERRRLYEQFGKCLKLGAHEDATNRTKLLNSFAELMRYQTSVC